MNQTPEQVPREGRLVGIDFGTVRIGIAVTDPEQILASPYENYGRRDLSKDAEFFKQLAAQEQVVTFVVGLPVHMSGDSSRMSEEAMKFGRWLAETTNVPVVWFDERYTSSIAKQALSEGKLSRKKQKKRLDMLAAQILLAAFLESDRTGQEFYAPSIDG